jgi:hypothetical protein
MWRISYYPPGAERQDWEASFRQRGEAEAWAGKLKRFLGAQFKIVVWWAQ